MAATSKIMPNLHYQGSLQAMLYLRKECPAKAIKIEGGQAEVISTRCIACGNCTMVCSQGAKAYIRETDKVESLLKAKLRQRP